MEAVMEGGIGGRESVLSQSPHFTLSPSCCIPNGCVQAHIDAGADLSWSKPLPDTQELVAMLVVAFTRRGLLG